ncbi:hypothetical protein BGZ58_003542 [Dissophora ornata]|nr:hypothetical protein BGZ58_003542 [Dissophora ornata]
MDVSLREVLCSNQMGMCTSSCQNKVQDNTWYRFWEASTCSDPQHPFTQTDVETLEWTCICSGGTIKMFDNWQFPIPFKLCRMNLLDCLQACPGSAKISNQGPGAQVADSASGDWQSSRQQQQVRLSLPDGVDNDFDQDDFDAIEEIQLLQRHSKIEGSYSRFEEEGRKKNVLNKKKKQLHKQLWAKQRNEIESESRVEIDVIGGGGDKNDWSQEIIAFTTLSDPTARRDPKCVARCQTDYSCGTESAPVYRGVMQIPRVVEKMVAQDSEEQTD